MVFKGSSRRVEVQGENSFFFSPAHIEFELEASKELQCVGRRVYQSVTGGSLSSTSMGAMGSVFPEK